MKADIVFYLVFVLILAFSPSIGRLLLTQAFKGPDFVAPDWAKVSTLHDIWRVPAFDDNGIGRLADEDVRDWLGRCCLGEFYKIPGYVETLQWATRVAHRCYIICLAVMGLIWMICVL